MVGLVATSISEIFPPQIYGKAISIQHSAFSPHALSAARRAFWAWMRLKWLSAECSYAKFLIRLKSDSRRSACSSRISAMVHRHARSHAEASFSLQQLSLPAYTYGGL